ncbi:ribonuclease Z [Labedaea rhizosphaerae]|uniref:Ribonuclease Z n=1 Tax=Labedaea rhizosphaerae TaxID=598644 RepID=A0A4R6SEH7_LABRH|nr:ribonuclease Z [Labedaea rhizosphaerae]
MRELVVLGTASMVPTRTRSHNAYLLRWDRETILFDPGEGTQRQMLFAGVSVSPLTRICVSHFHGDHCLGLPGVIQRLSIDGVAHPVAAHFPASGARYFERLRHASSFHETAELVPHPVTGDGPLAEGPSGVLEAYRLDHVIDSVGYRLVEPDGHTMVPELLARHGIAGPDVSRLVREGSLGSVRVEDVSVPRPGQRFGFVMDTRLCDGVYRVAEGADLLVIEATFRDADHKLAHDYGHLTAGQAGKVAAESGVRTLVLTHFSQRYQDFTGHHDEAAEHFGGSIVVADDLMRIPVPKRRP